MLMEIMLSYSLQMYLIGAHAARVSQNLALSEQYSLDFHTQHVPLLLPRRAIIAAHLIVFVSDANNRTPN